MRTIPAWSILLGAFCAAPAAAADLCASGFVWREARPADHVCVTPESRQRVRDENATASDRWDSRAGSGPASCKQGYVWREAFDGDTVCVTPETRQAVRTENSVAASRVAH